MVVQIVCAGAFRPAHPKPDFRSLDTDHDSSLSSTELQAYLDGKFKRETEALVTYFDSDSDGSITQAEYDQKAQLFFNAEDTRSWFWASLDSDHDGVITPEETSKQQSLILTASAQEAGRHWTAKHDLDDDQQVSQEEFMSFPDLAGKSNAGLETFAKMDMDGDGGITTAEFLRSAGQFGKADTFIDVVDTDGNGIISHEEFSALHSEL